jgi:hypothetical protein
MKRALFAIMLATWVLSSTLWLTQLWLEYWYEFPWWPPMALVSWFVDLYGPTNGEEGRDGEFLFGVIHFGILVSLLTWLGLVAGRRILRRYR